MLTSFSMLFAKSDTLPAIIKNTANSTKVTVTALMADKDIAKCRNILKKAVLICLGRALKKLIMF